MADTNNLNDFLNYKEVKSANGLQEMLAIHSDLWELRDQFRSAQGVERVKCAVKIAHKLHQGEYTYKVYKDVFPYTSVGLNTYYSICQFSSLELIVTAIEEGIQYLVIYAKRESFFEEAEYEEYIKLSRVYWDTASPYYVEPSSCITPLSEEEMEELLLSIE
ncbi:MAG TPA: hypothetical protein VJY47_00460 [Candidatus Dojkabacteria bacterium]|nr:hypothetical protein [Candidatus Dojkabacteria bacterium]